VIANERRQTRHEHTIDCPAFDADRSDTGRPLFLRQLGKNGPLLAFLPGIGSTTRYWELVVGSLANRMRLVLVDLLGFGRSPKPWTTYSVRQRTSNGWLWTHMIPFALMCLLGRRMLGWAAPMIAHDVPRPIAEDINQMTWRSSTSTMWEVIYRHDLADDVVRLPARVPLLCLHGDRDESAPLEGMRELQRLHPNCVIRALVGADHRLPLRHSEWLRDQLAGRRLQL